MKKLALSIACLFLPLCSFANSNLMCPSLADINNAIEQSPYKSIGSGDDLPTHPGFTLSWYYMSSIVLTKATEFKGVFIPVNSKTSSSLRCVYEGIDRDSLPFQTYFVNDDKGPYLGVVGTWQPVGRSSNCISQDTNECQFIRQQ
jgi:hypothetical protein